MLLYRFINQKLIQQPHRLLPVLVFLGIVLAALYNPHSPFYTFALADPDDYMRLNETINWLQWAGWFDLSHPRLAPGAHTVLHWSRLLDLPLAALMEPFLKDWGYRSSALIAALIEPVILLGFLLMLVPAMVRPILGGGRARLAILFVPFAPSLLFNFSPGRVDHHNWEILIAGIGMMALPRLLLCRGGWKAGLFAAMSFAIGMWISPEIMPILILMLGCIAIFGAWRGGFALRNAALFGMGLALATAAVLPAAVARSEWNNMTVSWFSSAYVLFAALAGTALLITWLLGCHTQNKSLRLTLAVALAGFATLVFFCCVPEALNGPFADFDDFNATRQIDNIVEAQPLLNALTIKAHNPLTITHALLSFMRFIFPGLVGLCVCLYGATAKRRRARLIWLTYAAFLAGTLALAIIAESRILWFTQLFLLAPLSYLTWNLGDKCRPRWISKKRVIVSTLLFLLLGPLLSFGVPAFAEMALPASQNTAACPLKLAAEYIAGPWGYVDRPYVILASADDGPELLFRTPHHVIAGNFNVPSNQDVYDFFSTRDEATPQNILRKWHVDLVLTCRAASPFYAGTQHPQPGKNAFLKLESDGKLHLVSSLTTPTFAEKLVNGPIPDWLKPVEIPATNDYLLFEVHLPAITKSKSP